ncbi:hypothetical protein Mtc_2506 [Methanocella conradii HZ254]|uniref:Uncharacterized protein n=1 Tax=Methanocella conradii (strain DSM 24694 / JCM 17849 / CGMCC 1.5162 / HZ254) TaxID=1041930 RepID=H8I7M1_METCZ|nr:hypothetical protein [Methanocella conradii]AFD01231.1 hypothetical protein Mtc_2506 [Methanocella conradii HZ254]MDI6898155.1 hypothetical protein [Methanocella conradii]
MSSGSGVIENAGPVGDRPQGLIYNDDLLECVATIILLGSRPGAKSAEALPRLKKILYDYDIYMLSSMSDEDVEGLAKTIRENGVDGIKLADRKLKEKLMAIRDNARVFVSIASEHNSVRAYIDKIMKDSGAGALEEAFTSPDSKYKLRLFGAAACKKLLKQL